MCGIYGAINGKEVSKLLLDGLRTLEYRGYDSSGIATVHEHQIASRRAKGKLVSLEELIHQNPIAGNIGIAHTRWATHGIPSENNAHPHRTNEVAVVHNGIIENYQSLRSEFMEYGYAFESDTDSEVVPIMLTHYLSEVSDPMLAFDKMLSRLQGEYALGVVFSKYDDLILAARKGSPLVVGAGNNSAFIASDALALNDQVSHILYLEDGDKAVLQRDNITFFDQTGNEVLRKSVSNRRQAFQVVKGEYRHFMLKEIYEQPKVLRSTLDQFFSSYDNSLNIKDLNIDFKKIERINIVACGTSYYAGMVAKYWIESLTGISVDVDMASEFRYRQSKLKVGSLALFISQSGETADTLAAMRYVKLSNIPTLAIVNVESSTMAREADHVLHTLAGPEIGVASTKAFSTQLMVLLSVALHAARHTEVVTKQDIEKVCHYLTQLPSQIELLLNNVTTYQEVADQIKTATTALFVGRGNIYPIAMEGALKLKEISYIHAEGYAAGELKHGPIALIESNTPIIVLAPYNHMFDKIESNIREIAARGGRLFIITDQHGSTRLHEFAEWIIELPYSNQVLTPFLCTIPVQLLAYYVALAKGTDVDQPRNLAKSVTVE